MNGRFVLRTRWFSVPLRTRTLTVLAVLALLIVAVMVLNMGLGQFPIPPLDVLKTVLGQGAGEYDFIVNTLRLPRTLVGFAVGAAFGLSGGILQGISRNPLAAPDVIGVTAGANLAAVWLIVMVPAAPAMALLPVAFGGALAATALTYVLSWKGGSSPIRMVLVGLGVAAVAQALVTVMTTSGKIYVVGKAMVWMSGSVYGRSWEHLSPLLPWLAVFVPLALLLARHLNALHLGDDVARGLGVRMEWHRGLLLLTAVALAGAATATAGAVGFVGLMAPHISRRLVGGNHGALLPTAALTGGLIVLVADMIGRNLFAPLEIPCGVITAAIGAPYLVWLLLNERTTE